MKKIVFIAISILIISIICFSKIKSQKSFQENLRTSINLQGDWIVRNQTDRGDINYLQNIKTGELSRDYHLVRETAIFFALSQLYEINKKPEFKKTLEKGFDYFSHLAQSPKKYSPSNAPAFILLGLINYMENEPESQKKYLPIAKNLADYLVSTQNSDGSFTVVKDFKKEDEYNDGESLLALIKMYNFNHDFLYLSSAQKAADYQIKKYDSKPVSTAYYAWGMESFANLYKIDPQEKYWGFMKTYTDKFLENKNIKTIGDYLDKKNDIRPSGNLSVYIEGLSHVAWIAREKDPKYYLKLKKIIEKSLSYLMTLQINGPKSAIKSEFPNIQGGLCFNSKCQTMRIDTIQHNISAVYYYLKFVH